MGLARPTGWHLAASPMRGWLDEQLGPVVTRYRVHAGTPIPGTETLQNGGWWVEVEAPSDLDAAIEVAEEGYAVDDVVRADRWTVENQIPGEGMGAGELPAAGDDT